MIGQTISHYKILEKLGGGGMGIVYKAHDTRLDRHVALKFLPPDLTRDTEARERFIHEAKAASALQHPNICTIHDIDETSDNQLFIVMDCYEGETLKQMIEQGPLPIDKAIDIATQVAQGLAKAHESIIVHRDIKPANVMIGKDGIARIVDFGLAKLSSQTVLTKSGSTVGTAAYMSPEQARGEKVDHRTDIWSLGVVLYEMLTGHKPFESEYEQAMMYAILSGEPTPIEELRAEVPAEIIGIAQRALEKDKEKRFQSATEMAEVLQGQGKPQRKRISRKKKRMMWYAGLSVAVLLVAIGVFLSFLRAEPIDSIAVLPPRDLSNVDDEPLIEGILDGLIDELAKIRALTTKGRQSVLKFKKTTKSYAEIARELGGVKAFVEPTFQKTGNILRIDAKLIAVSDESVLWSDRFERDEADVMLLYREIAQNIVRRTGVEVTQQEQERLKKARKVNPEAYDALVTGKYFREKVIDEAVRKSEIHLKRAIALDSNYAEAYAELALTYAGFLQRGILTLDSARHLIEACALKALALDDQNAEAHVMLGYIGVVTPDKESPGREYRKAIELNPGSAEAHCYFAAYLNGQGRLTEGLAEARRSVRLDPLVLQYRVIESWALHWMGEHDEDVLAAKAAIEIDSTWPGAYWMLTRGYTYLSRFEDARQAWRKYESLAPGDIFNKTNLAILEAKMGRAQQAHTLIKEIRAEALVKGPEKNLLCEYWLGQAYALLNERDSAFACLNRAIQVDLRAALRNDEPAFENLRSDPRYAALKKKVGLE